MKELEMLLRQRWILKADQKEQYYRIRDNIGEVRKFASDKLGCQIIENSLLVKMEKVPVKPEEFMGIQEFSSKEEYAFLCILLMFLEDKDAQEQFILALQTETTKLLWMIWQARCFMKIQEPPGILCVILHMTS